MAPLAAFLSFRLGFTDGVSVVAAQWQRAFEELGWRTTTVGGGGIVNHLVPGLAIGATTSATRAELDEALDGADLVIVENLLTIPMNLDASAAVADALRGRPALLHHHDPPWQRERFRHVTELPVDDPAWVHVTINQLTEREFRDRGYEALTIYNGFDVDETLGDRAVMRTQLEIGDRDRLLLHPVRAIERKNVPAAIALTEATGSHYWLPGPVEEGYGETLDALLAAARCPVHRFPMIGAPDAYAAADAVLYPSTWEGFGLPPFEAAIHRKPIVVGNYPVADELRPFGFWWLPPDDPEPLREALASPARFVDELEHNYALTRKHFSHEAMRSRIAELVAARGWAR
ncbi:MAG: glycosyltransferase [Acidimicrobiia bacterium]